jgi:hypothetical protein
MDCDVCSTSSSLPFPQVQLSLISGNMFMRHFDGLYAVMPLRDVCSCSSGGQLPELPAMVAEAVGPDAWRQLSSTVADTCCTSRRSVAQQQQQTQQQQGEHQQQPCRTGERSLVILHQRLQPAVRPPFGLGGFVRGAPRKQAGNQLCHVYGVQRDN